SHSVATPRGGGIAVVLVSLLALLPLGVFGVLNWPAVCGLLGGGAIVAAIGFADDRRDVKPIWRLMGQFIAAAWIVGWLDSPPTLAHVVAGLSHPWIAYGIAAISLVWLSNLFNFMDGIDGIAGVE